MDLKAAFQFLEPSDGDNTDQKQKTKKQTNPNSLFAVWGALLGEIDVITLWLYATLQVLGGFYLFIFISAHTHDFQPWVNAAVLCSS